MRRGFAGSLNESQIYRLSEADMNENMIEINDLFDGGDDAAYWQRYYERTSGDSSCEDYLECAETWFLSSIPHDL